MSDPAAAAAALRAAVETMDRLRSPGGCPWDAEQTHATLAPYLIEEAYETLEAIETGDLAHLREELGDLLLQVLFHARLAEESDPRFSITDVADDLVAKLVRRHPHVFADVSVDSAADVAANWEDIKRAEKQRESATDGIAIGQPALALAAKLVSRARKAGVEVQLPGTDGVGRRLLAVVGEAVQAGTDPELALREAARAYRDAVREAERRIETVSQPLTGSEPSSVAGSVGRTDPPWAGAEKETLLAFLRYHRSTLRIKCAGLSPEQLVRRSVPPSSLCLLGLVRHLSEVEAGWLRVRLAGEPDVRLYSTEQAPDADLDVFSADAGSVAEAWRVYDEQVALVEQVIAAADLDTIAKRPTRDGNLPSLRWILVHLIEEYARHNGHADLLREAIDGATGE